MNGRLAVAGCALLLAACAAPPSGTPELAGRIWDVRGGRFIEEPELARRMREARYVLLGEVHDNPVHHALRARLIARLAPRTEIFFEQFDRPQDAALREAQLAGSDADALARAGKLDATWNWSLYRPLVEAALTGTHPVRAANLPNSAARRIAIAGKLDAGEMALADALARSGWSDVEEQALRAEILESHCGALPERYAPAMALAQRARDATMALALAEASAEAVLIAGNGHVRRDLGVPRYLPPGATVLSVGLLEVREGEPDVDAYKLADSGVRAFDYVWFTVRQPRKDPCEGFKAPIR